MREIMFRGMNLCGKWVYGDLRHDRMCMPDGKLQEYISVCGEPVVPKSVGQFTGLKDSTGKEIYEGDIVRFELPPMVLTNEKTAIGAVVYEYGQFLVKIHLMRFTIFSVINDCTVIGNIHDNPELLEAKALTKGLADLYRIQRDEARQVASNYRDKYVGCVGSDGSRDRLPWEDDNGADRDGQ